MSGKGSIKMAGIEEFGKNIYFRGIHKLRLQEEGVGGQKKTNLVNVVCERPHILSNLQKFNLLAVSI